MEKTLEKDRSSRNVALFGLVATVPAVSFGAYAIERDATDVAKPWLWALLAVYAVYTILSSCWLWLRYRHARLVIRDGEVVEQGIWKRVSIKLSDVVEARWSLFCGGTIRLTTPSARMSFLLSSRSVEDRREVVRYLHEAIDPARQLGWNLFAYKITSGYAEDEVKPAKKKEEFRPEDYVLVTRRRWDRLFGVALAIAVVPSAATSWYFQNVGPLVFMMGYLAIGWLSQRLTTPSEGRFQRRLMAPDEEMRKLYAFAEWSMLTLAGMLMAPVLIPNGWLRAFFTLAFGLAWFTSLGLAAYRERVEHKRRDQVAADRAAELREWRAME